MCWPKIYQTVAEFVMACKDCQNNEVPNSNKLGLLQPLEISTKCWDVVICNFLTELPKTKQGFDRILVIVDKLSKKALFEPLRKSCSGVEVFQIFSDGRFAKPSFLAKIICDRDRKFVSNYWKGIMETLKIKLNLSTEDQFQTDAQSENLIRTLSSMLRLSMQRKRKEWHQILSPLE